MKILKPGKVEMRKFVCPNCGCEFAAYDVEATVLDLVHCPQAGCARSIKWSYGEPYEEHTQSDRDRLYGILLTANPIVTTSELTNLLIDNGVTFKEKS